MGFLPKAVYITPHIENHFFTEAKALVETWKDMQWPEKSFTLSHWPDTSNPASLAQLKAKMELHNVCLVRNCVVENLRITYFNVLLEFPNGGLPVLLEVKEMGQTQLTIKCRDLRDNFELCSKMQDAIQSILREC